MLISEKENFHSPSPFELFNNILTCACICQYLYLQGRGVSKFCRVMVITLIFRLKHNNIIVSWKCGNLNWSSELVLLLHVTLISWESGPGEEAKLVYPIAFKCESAKHTYSVLQYYVFLFYYFPARLVLEGAVQLFVHTASKYDSCQILNFPRAKSTLNLNWFCGGKEPNRHHYVVRCAPDKIPVQPDKQVRTVLGVLVSSPGQTHSQVVNAAHFKTGRELAGTS